MCVNPSSPLGLTVERSTCSFRDAFNSAWQLAQTSGVKGSMNLAQQALLQTGSTHLEAAAKFWTTAKKGSQGSWPEHVTCTLADAARLLDCALFLLWK